MYDVAVIEFCISCPDDDMKDTAKKITEIVESNDEAHKEIVELFTGFEFDEVDDDE